MNNLVATGEVEIVQGNGYQGRMSSQPKTMLLYLNI